MQITQTIIIFLFFIILFFFYLWWIYLSPISFEKKEMEITNSKNKRIHLDVEIADNFKKRSRGLMGRNQLNENEGMLFIFKNPDRYGFWMVNTTIPLDVVFFNEKREIVDIIQMEPCNDINISKCKVYKPKENAKYVLEVNKGFCEKNDIKLKNKFRYLE